MKTLGISADKLIVTASSYILKATLENSLLPAEFG